MSRVREETKVIPGAVWVIAAFVYLAFVGLMILSTGNVEEGEEWAIGPRVAFCVLLPLVMFVYTLLAGYVYGDARRRGMRYVMWTLLAIFIPNAIGFILYFILREPLLRHCPKCGASASSSFPFCPTCGVPLAPSCPECRRPVDLGWSHCAQCGTGLRQA